MIKLIASKCIRLLHKDISCDRCEQICPVDAISIKGGRLPIINKELCVGCGVCDSVCPTEAFELDDFIVRRFIYAFVEEKDNVISCKKNVPCIAALSVEHIIALALLKQEIVFDMGHCDNCEIASTCKRQILKNYEEASYVLDALQSNANIKLQKLSYDGENFRENNKDFIRNFIKTPFEKEVDKTGKLIEEYISKREDNSLLRQKNVQEKTIILLSAIRKMKKPDIFHVIDANELSFVSSKLMDSSKCTACRMCYVVCPTGALTSNIKNSKIDFDASLCVKCSACHEVCESDAITPSPSFNLKELFDIKAKNLINFKLKECKECGMFFSSNDDGEFCPRCSNPKRWGF